MKDLETISSRERLWKDVAQPDGVHFENFEFPEAIEDVVRNRLDIRLDELHAHVLISQVVELAEVQRLACAVLYVLELTGRHKLILSAKSCIFHFTIEQLTRCTDGRA